MTDKRIEAAARALWVHNDPDDSADLGWKYFIPEAKEACAAADFVDTEKQELINALRRYYSAATMDEYTAAGGFAREILAKFNKPEESE